MSRSRRVEVRRLAPAAALLAAVVAGCDRQPGGSPAEPADKPQAMAVLSTHSHAQVNGLRMYYESHGSGQPLVLLHGAFGVAESWRPLIPELIKDRLLLIPEQQGHGRTEDRDGPLTYEQMADDTASLLRHLGRYPADLFGVSDGGVVALGIAIRHPELVRRVAILGAHAGSLKDTYDTQAYTRIEQLSDDFAPRELKDPYDRVALDPGRWTILVRKVKRLSLDFQGYTSRDLRSIDASTLIMLGDRDTVRPEHGVEMFRQVRKAQLAILPASDHFVLFTNPGRVLAVLLPFLDAPAGQ